VLGLSLEKSHSAADWSTRPLPADWLLYAALDVEVLVELRNALAQQLAEQGKAEWAQEEFAAVLAASPPAPRAEPWRRTSGIHRVRNRRGLSIVRELWQERDRIARQRDLSPTRVLSDAAIIEAARAVPRDAAALSAVTGFTSRGARRHAGEWLRAVQRATATADADLPESSAPAGDGPPPAHRWQERDPAAARRLAAVRAAVTALAAEHGLPAENLVLPDTVRRLAWQPPDPVSPESVTAALAGHGARRWQIDVTAVALSAALLAAAEPDPDPDPEPGPETLPEGA
jgi:ribonuclease D